MIGIDLVNVSKSYQGRLSALFRRREAFWSLKDISFSIRGGESVGVIGRNGSGKTTLLRLIAQITRPTRGEIRVSGHVTALIGMEGCLNRALSAEDNVRFLMLMHELSGPERGRIFEEVREFSGLADFMKMPVKKFSGGMISRLYLSLGVHLPVDIFLLDEVLALGDEMFQQKCLGKIAELKRLGKIILFVSHRPEEVEGVCDRVLWLEKGRLLADGPTGGVLPRYSRPNRYFEMSRTDLAG